MDAVSVQPYPPTAPAWRHRTPGCRAAPESGGVGSGHPSADPPPLPQVCDEQWHHYVLNVEVPRVTLYVDGVSHEPFSVTEDYPLHPARIETQLVVGACWQGNGHGHPSPHGSGTQRFRLLRWRRRLSPAPLPPLSVPSCPGPIVLRAPRPVSGTRCRCVRTPLLTPPLGAGGALHRGRATEERFVN